MTTNFKKTVFETGTVALIAMATFSLLLAMAEKEAALTEKHAEVPEPVCEEQIAYKELEKARIFTETPKISHVERLQVEDEKSITPEEDVEIEPSVALYDIPLDEDLQLYVIGICEEKHIDPAIVFAMCYRESSYKATKMGDGGDSYGLMQVQPKWHSDRMAKLGVTDLLDPYQNVTVGIDYLAEQLERYDGDMAKALTAYNAGHYKGKITQYAKNVLQTAEELEVIGK